ncbi:MAG: hypothetical protein UR98_C0003G0013 [Parcubacteria group bacterium GW2011_GWA1_36_12]|nr:MAG: hypothetical protein UR98_C0003G0013 [Parcubacteria group bacterium GW2011_GWA1_36_12]
MIRKFQMSDFKYQISRNKLIFVLLFIVLGFIALQVPINKLAGSRVSFTFFDLFAPISGAFLGSVYGIIAVFLIQGFNLMVHGVSNIDKGAIIRLFPTLFAVLYFAISSKPKAKNYILIVPLVSMIAFNLHPIGRTVWYYSLFWLIPFIVWPLRNRFLLARALGATFTAHSVGGAVWIWAFSLPASVWTSLIPVVAMERFIFALGISASYILMNNILAYFSLKSLLPKNIGFNKKYVFLKSK